MKNPNALTEAQSASEMFDVMQPPPTSGFDIFTMKGVPTGEVKSRGLVHRDQDWHRSVHVWLVDREKQVVALQKRSPNKVSVCVCVCVRGVSSFAVLFHFPPHFGVTMCENFFWGGGNFLVFF